MSVRHTGGTKPAKTAAGNGDRKSTNTGNRHQEHPDIKSKHAPNANPPKKDEFSANGSDNPVFEKLVQQIQSQEQPTLENNNHELDTWDVPILSKSWAEIAEEEDENGNMKEVVVPAVQWPSTSLRAISDPSPAAVRLQNTKPLDNWQTQNNSNSIARPPALPQWRSNKPKPVPVNIPNEASKKNMVILGPIKKTGTVEVVAPNKSSESVEIKKENSTESAGNNLNGSNSVSASADALRNAAQPVTPTSSIKTTLAEEKKPTTISEKEEVEHTGFTEKSTKHDLVQRRQKEEEQISHRTESKKAPKEKEADLKRGSSEKSKDSQASQASQAEKGSEPKKQQTRKNSDSKSQMAQEQRSGSKESVKQSPNVKKENQNATNGTQKGKQISPVIAKPVENTASSSSHTKGDTSNLKPENSLAITNGKSKSKSHVADYSDAASTHVHHTNSNIHESNEKFDQVAQESASLPRLNLKNLSHVFGIEVLLLLLFALFGKTAIHISSSEEQIPQLLHYVPRIIFTVLPVRAWANIFPGLSCLLCCTSAAVMFLNLLWFRRIPSYIAFGAIIAAFWGSPIWTIALSPHSGPAFALLCISIELSLLNSYFSPSDEKVKIYMGVVLGLLSGLSTSGGSLAPLMMPIIICSRNVKLQNGFSTDKFAMLGFTVVGFVFASIFGGFNFNWSIREISPLEGLLGVLVNPSRGLVLFAPLLLLGLGAGFLILAHIWYPLNRHTENSEGLHVVISYCMMTVIGASFSYWWKSNNSFGPSSLFIIFPAISVLLALFMEYCIGITNSWKKRVIVAAFVLFIIYGAVLHSVAMRFHSPNVFGTFHTYEIKGEIGGKNVSVRVNQEVGETLIKILESREAAEESIVNKYEYDIDTADVASRFGHLWSLYPNEISILFQSMPESLNKRNEMIVNYKTKVAEWVIEERTKFWKSLTLEEEELFNQDKKVVVETYSEKSSTSIEIVAAATGNRETKKGGADSIIDLSSGSATTEHTVEIPKPSVIAQPSAKAQAPVPGTEEKPVVDAKTDLAEKPAKSVPEIKKDEIEVITFPSAEHMQKKEPRAPAPVVHTSPYLVKGLYLGSFEEGSLGDHITYETALRSFTEAFRKEGFGLALNVLQPQPVCKDSELQRWDLHDYSFVIFGGGSFLHTNYMCSLFPMLDKYPSLPIFVFGTGFDDPALITANRRVMHQIRAGDLSAITFPPTALITGAAKLMNRDPLFGGVRGTISAALLQRMQIGSNKNSKLSIIGEPLLISSTYLVKPQPVEKVKSDVVSPNDLQSKKKDLSYIMQLIEEGAQIAMINYAEKLGKIYGDDPANSALSNTIASAMDSAITFLQLSHTVVLFATRLSDIPALERLREVALSLGVTPARIIALDYIPTAKELTPVLQKTSVAITMRYAATAMVASAHVPLVALAYRLKIVELCDSLGLQEYVIRTDDVNHTSLMNLVNRALENGASTSNIIRTAKEKIEKQFSHEITRLVNHVKASKKLPPKPPLQEPIYGLYLVQNYPSGLYSQLEFEGLLTMFGSMALDKLNRPFSPIYFKPFAGDLCSHYHLSYNEYRFITVGPDVLMPNEAVICIIRESKANQTEDIQVLFWGTLAHFNLLDHPWDRKALHDQRSTTSHLGRIGNDSPYNEVIVDSLLRSGSVSFVERGNVFGSKILTSPIVALPPKIDARSSELYDTLRFRHPTMEKGKILSVIFTDRSAMNFHYKKISNDYALSYIFGSLKTAVVQNDFTIVLLATDLNSLSKLQSLWEWMRQGMAAGQAGKVILISEVMGHSMVSGVLNASVGVLTFDRLGSSLALSSGVPFFLVATSFDHFEFCDFLMLSENVIAQDEIRGENEFMSIFNVSLLKRDQEMLRDKFAKIRLKAFNKIESVATEFVTAIQTKTNNP